MSIKTITAEDLRRMKGQEGLVLQACVGEPQEWLDDINELLADDGILLEGTKLENAEVFTHDKRTNIYLPFDGSAKIDMGKFAMWRFQFRELFPGTWLSDYVENRLGGFVAAEAPAQKKPDCKLIGEDGNIFNLTGIAARTLRQNGLAEQAKEMSSRVFACGSYDEALGILGEYVNITGEEESEDMDEGMGMQL